MHFCRPWRKHVQSFKTTGIQLYKVPTVYTAEVRKRQNSQRRKMWQKLMQGLYQRDMHIFWLWRNMRKVSKKIGIKLFGSCAHEVLTVYILRVKMTSSQCGKSDKKWSNNCIQTIYTSSHHEKTYAKFQNDMYKTVRGVALTRGTHCLYIVGEKWLILQCRKGDKDDLTIMSKSYQIICTSSYHEENTFNVSKRSVQNCKRSCAHKRYPLSFYWGWKMTKFTM